MRWDVRIPLRDGVALSATLYMPAGRSGSSPAIFTLTPYVGQRYHEEGVYFAENGFPFLTIDVRGRGNSDGHFSPNPCKGEDGYDVVEWIAAQSFCNGKVAMWGASYGGHVQWMTAAAGPQHLETIAPAAAPHFGLDFPMRANIGSPYVMQWLALVAGRTAQDHIFGDQKFWSRRLRQWREAGVPFKELDTYLGQPSAIFQEWSAHPHLDEYWSTYNPSPRHYEQLSLPVLTITGIYDGDQLGALTHYRQHMRSAPPEVAARHCLVVGPWDHAGCRVPRAHFGGITVGPAGVIDLKALHLQWYRWTLCDGPRPDLLRKRVAYYVLGAEEWRHADSLEEVATRRRLLYLQSTANPDDVFHSGSLTWEPILTGGPDHYRYDASDVSHSGLESEADPECLTDQRMMLSPGSHLIYHSEPLQQGLEVCGFFGLSLWLSIDQPDTDFHVSVALIDGQGGSIILGRDSLRARHRTSPCESELIRTTEPLRYDFNGFNFVARRLEPGQRLRLAIGALSSIYVEKNYNSGGVVSEETLQQSRVVTVRLLHDSQHPSALHVPIAALLR